MKTKRFCIHIGTVLAIVLIDHASKLWTHFYIPMGHLGEIKIFGDWFKIHYTLNPGMAFGMEMSLPYGKLILTLVRIWITYKITSHVWWLVSYAYERSLVLTWSWTLILGGAIGNAIDSIFYGFLLDNVQYDAPTAWFHGQVIDMFFLDIYDIIVPSWIPFLGNSSIGVFPIFNIADIAICIGVSGLVLGSTSGPTHEKYPLNSDAKA